MRLHCHNFTNRATLSKSGTRNREQELKNSEKCCGNFSLHWYNPEQKKASQHKELSNVRKTQSRYVAATFGTKKFLLIGTLTFFDAQTEKGEPWLAGSRDKCVGSVTKTNKNKVKRPRTPPCFLPPLQKKTVIEPEHDVSDRITFAHEFDRVNSST